MLPLLLTIGGGLLGAAKSANANAARERQNKVEVEKTRNSAWSGLGGGQVDTNFDSPLIGAASGAIGGLGAAQSLSGMDLSSLGLGGDANSYAPQVQPDLGAGSMNAQLGSMGSSWNFQPSPQYAMMGQGQGVFGQMRSPMGPNQFYP